VEAGLGSERRCGAVRIGVAGVVGDGIAVDVDVVGGVAGGGLD
jgi:hypothetical protein